MDKTSGRQRPGRGQALYARAKQIIPGGTQLLSKRPEMLLPGQWPCYFETARGAEVTDLDGRTYIDTSYAGLGSCILGYADPDVNEAVHRAVELGVMSTLNCPEEVELAELLLELHPWADMVRYARTGGEAMAVAVRIARAATGRDKIAFCGYHGWHDWYLSANLGSTETLDGHLLPGLQPAGVPRNLRGTVLPFRYNHIEELEAIVAAHGPELAAIVMEPVRNTQPLPGFLEAVRALATETGAALIFDEITAGFRLTTGGAHRHFGISPDCAVFAKGLSNGFAMSAVIGVGRVMEAARGTFVSSTYWTERIGPVAALATLRKHRALSVAEHLIKVGEQVQRGWEDLGRKHGLQLEVGGIAPLGHFSFRYDNGQAIRTLFTQLMLDRGFLATGAFYAMYAHTSKLVSDYLAAVDDSFARIAEAIAANAVEESLRGPVADSGFKRLT